MWKISGRRARRGARFQRAVSPFLAKCPAPPRAAKGPFESSLPGGAAFRPRDILTLKSVRYGRLAQLGERGVRNAEVVGSNPMPSTKIRSRTYNFFFT